MTYKKLLGSKYVSPKKAGCSFCSIYMLWLVLTCALRCLPQCKRNQLNWITFWTFFPFASCQASQGASFDYPQHSHFSALNLGWHNKQDSSSKLSYALLILTDIWYEWYYLLTRNYWNVNGIYELGVILLVLIICVQFND